MGTQDTWDILLYSYRTKENREKSFPKSLKRFPNTRGRPFADILLLLFAKEVKLAHWWPSSVYYELHLPSLASGPVIMMLYFSPQAIAFIICSTWNEALFHHGPLSLTHSLVAPQSFRFGSSSTCKKSFLPPLPSLGQVPGLGSCIFLAVWPPLYLCSTHNVWKWSLCGGGTFLSSCYLMRVFPQDKGKRK